MLLTPVLTFVFCRLVLDFFCSLLLKKVFVFLVSPQYTVDRLEYRVSIKYLSFSCNIL